MSFEELGVRPELVRALAKMEILEPTGIQAAALPVLTSGQDAHMRAETGSGKTLAYLLPLISRIDVARSETQILVLAPTHELAIQIQRVCTDLAQHSGLALRALLLIGATATARQIEKLKKKPHIAVGSSGRIRDLIQMGKLKAHTVRHLVIDEADRLLAPENIAAVREIVKAVPRSRQMVYVSASDTKESNQAMAEVSPALVQIQAAEAPTVSPTVEHLYLVCEDRQKIDFVRKLWHALEPERAIVFVHKNERADVVSNKLAFHNLEVADLHAALDKRERQQAMEAFRSGQARLLIASDIAARGLDVKGVTHIFNLDVPTESRAYLHRVGRTGRAGAAGTAITLMNETEVRLVKRYQTELGITLKLVTLREGQLHFA